MIGGSIFKHFKGISKKNEVSVKSISGSSTKDSHKADYSKKVLYDRNSDDFV